MSFDLNTCSQKCFECISHYKQKHSFRGHQSFGIGCRGILSEDSTEILLNEIPEESKQTAMALLDPVTWAKINLDWHCIDPDGEVWKRKNPVEWAEWQRDHRGENILGSSRYHRPKQAEILRCTSKYKVARIGRQFGKTESIVIDCIYHAMTRPGVSSDTAYKIIVVTPYQSQVEVIFDRTRELISNSPLLSDEISRYAKSPRYIIEFKNNAIIKGFTAGTKSGGKAGQVRGQHAHFLVLDEADMLSKDDLDAVMSIITNWPQAKVWMSSTPTGKREGFFETCMDPQWREFFFTSRENPMWNEDTERMFKNRLTATGFQQEVLAEFGEENAGVFQNAYIEAAKKDYHYADMKPTNGWVYTVGTDWNDEANGTTIAVTGFNPADNCFHLVKTYNISRAGWTQLEACNKIAEINRIWSPVSIYLDAGYGGTQWEVLRKYSYDAAIDPARGSSHPDANLRHVLKQYDFGSKVEVRDLWTHQISKKPAKPFLVNSMVRLFESSLYRYPASDHDFTKQLENYIIRRYSESGQPIYGCRDERIGDHMLDAAMLSVVAFILEKTPLGKPTSNLDFCFSGNIGQPKQSTEGFINIKKEERVDMKERLAPVERWEKQAPSPWQEDTGLPGSNLNIQADPVKLWSWPGFGHDAPCPTTKKQTRRRGMRSRYPSRKQI